MCIVCVACTLLLSLTVWCDSLLPQPKSVPTEEGEGEGEGEESLLNKMANQWMSTRDLMKVCVCVCVRACVCV